MMCVVERWARVVLRAARRSVGLLEARSRIGRRGGGVGDVVVIVAVTAIEL